MRALQSRAASAAEIEAVHSSAHMAVMKRRAAEDAPCVIADFECKPDNTTYMAPSSFDDALLVRMLACLWPHAHLMHDDLLPTYHPAILRDLQPDVMSHSHDVVFSA